MGAGLRVARWSWQAAINAILPGCTGQDNHRPRWLVPAQRVPRSICLSDSPQNHLPSQHENTLCPSTGHRLACLIVRSPSQRYARATQIGETEAQSSHLPHHQIQQKGCYVRIQTQSQLPSKALLLPGDHATGSFNTHQPQLQTREVRGTHTLPKKDTSQSGDTQQVPDTSPQDCRCPDLTS